MKLFLLIFAVSVSIVFGFFAGFYFGQQNVIATYTYLGVALVGFFSAMVLLGHCLPLRKT